MSLDANSSLRDLILNKLSEPTIFYNCIEEWPALKWSLQDWSQQFKSHDPLPFRSGVKKFSQTPQWENTCCTKSFTFLDFIQHLQQTDTADEWLYFDYKHMREWFTHNPEVLQSINWGCLGFPERGGEDSTLWIGSAGAHTPCHVDTYGCNLVAQLHGVKQWILFPPDVGQGIRPTRVPYEESSIYSDINFYSPPKDVSLKGARVHELRPGEVLFVPSGWWHYVETVSPAAVSINTWIPLPGDNIKRLEEALVRTWVSSVCQLSSISTLLNPNESDVPHDENLLTYLRLSLDQCTSEVEPVSKKPRLSSPQSQELSPTLLAPGPDERRPCVTSTETEPSSDVSPPSCAVPLPTLPERMSRLAVMSEEQLSALLDHKRARFTTGSEEDTASAPEVDKNFALCKKLINAVCDKEVVALIAKKLIRE